MISYACDGKSLREKNIFDHATLEPKAKCCSNARAFPRVQEMNIMLKKNLDSLLSLYFMIFSILVMHVLELGHTFNSYIHSSYIYHKFKLMLSKRKYFCLSHLKGWLPPTQGCEQVFEWLIPWWGQ